MSQRLSGRASACFTLLMAVKSWLLASLAADHLLFDTLNDGNLSYPSFATSVLMSRS